MIGPRKVLIVDDHPVVRYGFSQLIEDENDLEVCGEAETAAETLRFQEEESCDVIILDLSLGDGGGLELIKLIRARHEELPILVASMHDELLFAPRALQAGAQGYVNKQEAMDRIIEALRRVLDGRIYLSDRMSDRMLHSMVGKPAADDLTPASALSDRELQVFEMIGRGTTTRQIAESLNLSVKTIETHRQNIKIKLNLENNNELIRQAMQWTMENA